MTSLPKPLPIGWFMSPPAKSAELHDELRKELPPGHRLYGVEVAIVAHREGTDDILCRHLEHPDRFTVIHLSWTGRTEIDPSHPCVEEDGSFEMFLDYEKRFYGNEN